ncbi:hypothetical protein BG004_001635, partial [Podila humilis]
MDHNSSMDELLDFSVLSLHTTEEKLQMQFDHTLHIHDLNDLHQSQQQQQKLQEEAIEQIIGADHGRDEQGPWAKLPFILAEVNPYQPGLNAQKLDAMAMDPNHVFKSSSISFPLTEPTTSTQEEGGENKPSSSSSSSSAAAAASGAATQARTAEGEENIPEWMLADPEMTPNWTNTSQSGISVAPELDWSSSAPDLSTTVDPGALFGFSSFPSYENLSISSAIANELYRQQQPEDVVDRIRSSFTGTREGGFARFVGNSTDGTGDGGGGGGSVAPSNSLGEGSDNFHHHHHQHHQQNSLALSGGSEAEQGQGRSWQPGNGASWQNWRSSSPMEVEVDVDDEYDSHFNNPDAI